MGDVSSVTTPTWAPGSVGSAYRHGPADGTELVSGRAWDRLVDSLARAGQVMRSDRAPGEETDQAAGYRHLLVLLALGIDEALRASDPYGPYFAPANVDNVLKWGMDCPDAAYTGASIRGDATYRVRGRAQLRPLPRASRSWAGIASTGNLVADDLDTGRGRPIRARAVGQGAPG